MADARHHNALASGEEVNWYRIGLVLGQGAFGITYLARDRNLDADVALKEYFPSAWAVRLPQRGVAPAGPAHERDFRWGLDRFVHEGRILARFDHPALVRVMSVFEANGTAYLVMRFERGAVLADVLAHAQALAEEDLKALLGPLLDGLRAMHAAGVIHRDIKPENIFLRSDGSPLLLDFGAARQAAGSRKQDLTSVGTAGYAPIEQYSDEDGRQGPWTDVYALGATLWQAVTGRPPRDALVRANAAVAGAPDPLPRIERLARGQFSPPFLRAIEHAMALRAEHRPQSVDTFARELGIVLPAPEAAWQVEQAADTRRSGTAPPAAAQARRVTAPAQVDTDQWEIEGIREAVQAEEAEQAAPHATPAGAGAGEAAAAADAGAAWRFALGPRSQDYYLRRLAPPGAGAGLSWNWAAALLTGPWLAWRRMALWAFVLYPLLAGASLAGAWWLGGAVFPRAPLAQLAVIGAALALVSLLAGAGGNALYVRHLRRRIEAVQRLDLEPAQRHRRLRERGGTSAVLAAVWIAAALALLGAGGWWLWRLAAAP